MKSISFWALTFCAFFSLQLNANADVLGVSIAATGKVAASVIAKETVESLIESARREATSLMAEAENTGNVLLVRAADELNLTADNIDRMFSKQLKSTFEEVDEDKRDFLIGLASATNAASELGDKAYTLKDTLALDVRSILGDIPFVKESLVLQRVSGLSVISGKEKIKIKVIGSYVGLPGEDHSTSLSVSVNGGLIEGLEVDPAEIHMAYIYIPSSAVADYLIDNKPARVPVTLNVDQKFKKRLFGFLWYVDYEKNYKADLNLTLYPKYAGTVDVVARHQILGWKPAPSIERDMTHSDHCSKKCGNHHGTTHEVSIVVNGDSSDLQVGHKRIVIASCSRIAGVSGYSVDEGTGVSQDKSSAKCKIRFRTQSQTYRLTAQVEEYGVIEEKDSSYSAEIKFDELTEVKIPKTTNEVFIKGVLVTGDKVDLVGSQTTTSGLVRVLKRLENTYDKSIVLTVLRPVDVM